MNLVLMMLSIISAATLSLSCSAAPEPQSDLTNFDATKRSTTESTKQLTRESSKEPTAEAILVPVTESESGAVFMMPKGYERYPAAGPGIPGWSLIGDYDGATFRVSAQTASKVYKSEDEEIKLLQHVADSDKKRTDDKMKKVSSFNAREWSSCYEGLGDTTTLAICGRVNYYILLWHSDLIDDPKSDKLRQLFFTKMEPK